MHDFDFTFADVADINSVPAVRQGKISNTGCPFCGKPGKFNVNDLPGKQVGRCNACGWSGGMLKFHMELNGLADPRAAKRDIEKRLSTGSACGRRYSPAMRGRNRTVAEEVSLEREERSRLYTHMADFLSLADDHRADMRKRGLPDAFMDARGYKTLPVEREDRYRLARQMHTDGYSVRYLPGFYMDDSGDYALTQCKRGYLIPVRYLNGQIEGYQIRIDSGKLRYKKHRDRNGGFILDENGRPALFADGKFRCLSTPGARMGGTFHSVCHYAGAYIWDEDRKDLVPVIKKRSVKFTEGPLKADVYYYLTGEPMIGILGVNNVRQLRKTILDILSYYPETDTIEDCLDMDYLDNPNVEKAVLAAENMVRDLGLKYVRKTWNPKFKGVDDFALAVRQGTYKKN